MFSVVEIDRPCFLSYPRSESNYNRDNKSFLHRNIWGLKPILSPRVSNLGAKQTRDKCFLKGFSYLYGHLVFDANSAI